MTELSNWQYKRNGYRCEGVHTWKHVDGDGKPGRQQKVQTAAPCGYIICTIDRDVGTTPAFIMCDRCNGLMASRFYRIPQDTPITHEWHRPTLEEFETLSEGIKDHVRMGGLIRREYVIPTLEDVTAVYGESDQAKMAREIFGQ